MIIFGWNMLFGRTDKIPGLLFVGTSFFHIFFIPLIPLGSYIVLYQDDKWMDGFKGIRIGFSPKSILFAWLRAAAVVGILIVLSRFLDAYWLSASRMHSSWPASPGWDGIAVIAICLFVLWVLRIGSVANDQRATELADIAASNPDNLAAFRALVQSNKT